MCHGAVTLNFIVVSVLSPINYLIVPTPVTAGTGHFVSRSLLLTIIGLYEIFPESFSKSVDRFVKSRTFVCPL